MVQRTGTGTLRSRGKHVPTQATVRPMDVSLFFLLLLLLLFFLASLVTLSFSAAKGISVGPTKPSVDLENSERRSSVGHAPVISCTTQRQRRTTETKRKCRKSLEKYSTGFLEKRHPTVKGTLLDGLLVWFRWHNKHTDPARS